MLSVGRSTYSYPGCQFLLESEKNKVVLYWAWACVTFIIKWKTAEVQDFTHFFLHVKMWGFNAKKLLPITKENQKPINQP